MPVNANKTHLWKADVAQSVDFYNSWFLHFAPQTYRDTRIEVTKKVEQALFDTSDLRNIDPELLRQYPSVLPLLRAATAPPIAQDRLSGLASVSRSLIENMEEKNRIPPQMRDADLTEALSRIGQVITRMVDEDIFPWIHRKGVPTEVERLRAATIVADRLCGMNSNPIIRNEQEKRQLSVIRAWLEQRGYTLVDPGKRGKFDTMPFTADTYRVLIASPSDLVEERQGTFNLIRANATLQIYPRGE
jgi:hypothetical protein